VGWERNMRLLRRRNLSKIIGFFKEEGKAILNMVSKTPN
jgi:hypothetical protein